MNHGGGWRKGGTSVFYSLHVESRASVAMLLIHFLISGVILAYSSKRSLGFPLFRLATPIATNLNKGSLHLKKTIFLLTFVNKDFTPPPLIIDEKPLRFGGPVRGVTPPPL